MAESEKMVDSVKKIFSILLVGADPDEALLIEKSLERTDITTTISMSHLQKSDVIKLPDDRDLTFYFHDDSQSESSIPEFNKQTVIVTPCYDKEINDALLFKKGARHILFQPLEINEVIAVAKQVLRDSRKYWKENLEDKNILKFLQFLDKNKIDKIVPSYSGLKNKGYFFPTLDALSDDYENIEEYLNALAKRGFLVRKINNRFRQCSQCHSHQLNYREICPSCSSIDIVQGQMIHHFHCGHIDSFDSYLRGTDLVCPKCEKTLRHIGLDYEKPADYFKCANCETIVPEPAVEPECLNCGLAGSSKNTLEKEIFTYYVTELATNAVERGEITDVDLASILYDTHTNLHNKQYFELELERETERFTRHKSTFTLMMARIGKIDEIQQSNPERVIWYVNMLFSALSKELRTLDTTCGWDGNTLGILLPETEAENAFIVAKRMNDNIMNLEYLFEIAKPEITFSVIQMEEELNGPEQLVSQAMSELEGEK